MTTNCKKAQGISLKIQNWVNSPNEKWRQLSFGFQLENRNSISLHQFNGDLLAIVGHHGYTEDQFIHKVTNCRIFWHLGPKLLGQDENSKS